MTTRRAALLLSVMVAGLLAGCGQDTDVESTPVPAEGSTSAVGSAPDAAAESAFLAATAAHLCEVQSGVYADAAELASAYALAPAYDELSDEHVAELTARLAADPAFSEELRQAIADSCG